MVEIAPVGLLLALCVALTVAAGPAMDYMQAAAEALHAPGGYLRGGPGRLGGDAGGRGMTRWLPYLLFAARTAALWLLLTGSASPGSLLLGAVLALGGIRRAGGLDAAQGAACGGSPPCQACCATSWWRWCARTRR